MTRLMVGAFAAVGWMLASVSPLYAADDDLKKLLDAAIKAQGGEEKINKLTAAQVKAKGTLEIGGMSIGIQQEISYQMPDKFREALELEVNGQKISVISVVNGDMIWIVANGTEMKVDDKIKAELKEARHMLDVMKLTPLKGKGYELSTIGEVKVEGKPAIGVKVAKKDHRDINLFFDKESHLIVKIDSKAYDAMSGQEVDQERIITEYGKSDGVPVPKKMIINRDGKKFLEIEITEYKVLDKLDDNHFAKP